jgi:hypothetical protein
MLLRRTSLKIHCNGQGVSALNSWKGQSGRGYPHYRLFFCILSVEDFDVPLELGLSIYEREISRKFTFTIGTGLCIGSALRDILGAGHFQ